MYEPDQQRVMVVSSAVVIFLVLFASRGLLTTVMDALVALKWVCRRFGLMKDFVTVGVQTQGEVEGLRLPEEIIFNKNSEVYHVRGCNFVGANVETRRVCNHCWRWQ